MAEKYKPKAGPGRGNTKYQNELTDLAVKYMAMAGLTDKEMAENIGISTSNFNAWKKKHPEFFENLSEGKAVADKKVVKSLFRMATGFYYDAEKPMTVSTGDFSSGIQIAKYKEFYKPVPVAAIFWLKNRLPEEWRDKQEVGLTDKNGDDLCLRISFADPDKNEDKKQDEEN